MGLQDEYGVVLKCILIIELIWVEKYGKLGEKHHYGENSRGCTGTEQSGTGADCVLPLVLYFDQCLYFDHNLVISDSI